MPTPTPLDEQNSNPSILGIFKSNKIFVSQKPLPKNPALPVGESNGNIYSIIPPYFTVDRYVNNARMVNTFKGDRTNDRFNT